MLQARILLEWHTKKEEWQRIHEKLESIRMQDEDLTKKIAELRKRIQSLGEPGDEDIDGKIALALARQELWMAEKEVERLVDFRFNEEILLREQEMDCQQAIDDLEKRITKDTFKIYEEVSEVCENPIVEVKRRSCMGCFLPLSMPTMNEWRKGKKIVRCEVCGRILV